MRKTFSMYSFPGLYFDADGGGSAGGDGEKKPEPKFTQEDVDRLVGEARKNGRETGISKLLEGLGAKDPEELKAAIEESRKLKDSQKTELEKLTERITQAEAKAATLQKEAEEKVAQMKKRILDSEIKSLAAKTITVEKDGKSTVSRQAFRPEAIEDVLVLLDRAGIEEKDDKFVGIDKALETLAKAKPHWLAEAGTPGPRSQGTPHQEHKQPQTDKESGKREPLFTSL